ncbi:hypothetical protein [Acetivibrio clariflavus]|uniref:Uncharacterized protein n=1 Tax=Acetivibrio clariflavus (strain DSM 19732 / NBRC 101661 / EBR45) TaxID=720554 RepID=G8M347_ACECE|nr:hypothetical protein [Acetivibrio clariflavus]AEV69356.1 hypothetical protein Clocl_2806 [Acetivibrio clariflavus DSM 19732]
MEKLKNCRIVIDIEEIESISCTNREFEVLLMSKDKKKYKIVFDYVLDMRYSIENASIDRFCNFRKNISENLIDNSFFIVENSEYIKYFKNQVSGTIPADNITHYILFDKVDTVIDILTEKEPILLSITAE